jgi:phage-related protein
MGSRVHILSAAQEYIGTLPVARYSTIIADIEDMRAGRFDRVHTKQLKGPIRELVSGRHRITYFSIGSTLYFVRGFAKKSTKTPKREIEYAQQIFNIINDGV